VSCPVRQESVRGGECPAGNVLHSLSVQSSEKCRRPARRRLTFHSIDANCSSSACFYDAARCPYIIEWTSIIREFRLKRLRALGYRNSIRHAHAANVFTYWDILESDLWQFNPLIAALKPQINGPSYRNTVIGTLGVDGWLLHLVQRGGDWAGPQPTQAPPRCTKCNDPPINDQCTNFVLFDVAL